MNIVLSGFIGSGKTKIAKSLSKKLNLTFIELDQYIQEKSGMTVTQIVELYTQQKFKQLESNALDEICEMDNCILTTCGGTLLCSDNLKKLKKFGKIVFLNISIDTIIKRLNHIKSNCDIKHTNKEDAIARLLMGRLPTYKSAADICIDANDNNTEKIVKIIINKLGLKLM